MKRKVFLVTGFNNWGKTHLIYGLFGVSKFPSSRLTALPGTQHEFLCMSASNDDIQLTGYVREMKKRLANAKARGLKPKYIITAFCPTAEPRVMIPGQAANCTSINLLRHLYSKDEVHMILIKHKWCLHAQLQVDVIRKFYAKEKNVTIHVVTTKSLSRKLPSLDRIVRARLP